MNNDPYKNRDHLGDGIYVHYNGRSYEISVNDHRNPPVVIFEENSIDAFNRFRERMENENS